MNFSAPEPIDLKCLSSPSQIDIWKENLVLYLSQDENYQLFLPGGIYSDWTPAANTLNGRRIKNLHDDDKVLQNRLLDSDPLVESYEACSISDSVLDIRNTQLSEMIEIICNLCNNSDTYKISDECSNFNSIMQLISDLCHSKDSKNSNILQLGDIQCKPSVDYDNFYLRLRSEVCANLKKKGDKVKGFLNDHLQEDEILSPTFEDVIVIWCLEKIDPRLPNRVNQTFGHQLAVDVTLKDIQKDVFKYIPVFLQEMSDQDQEACVDLMKVKSEDVKTTTGSTSDIKQDQEQKDFLPNHHNQNMKKDKGKPYWTEENLALLIEEEEDIHGGDDDQNNINSDNDDSLDVKEELPLELEHQMNTRQRKTPKKVKEEDGQPVKKRKYTKKVKYKEEPYVCQKCHMEFESEGELLTHISTHIDPSNNETAETSEVYSCVVCNKGFAKESVLTNHMIKHNGCDCDQCGEHFTTAKDLKVHLATHNGPEAYVCHECGKIFGRKDSLGKHIKRHVGRNLEKDSWTCHICGKAFNIKESFNGHLLWHKERFRCESCGRTYIGKNRLDSHVCKHFSCNECDKRFDKERNLKMHMRMHAGETMFPCNECEGLFDTKRKLNKHRNSAHRERRKYVCDECPKSFKGSAALKAHKLSHSGLRPYSCEHCERTFSQKPHLDKHKLVHTNEFPFPCSSCGKKFRSHGHVKYHIDTTKCGIKLINTNSTSSLVT